jgi:diguanylate cyclase (GGDEF)-like protein
VAMFDIDHFKLFNDHYGHMAGDDALRLVAHCIAHTVRADESIYRYGGEEFLLLLPDCNIDAAAAAARRIRESVSLMSIPHEARPTKPSVVTVSGGIACWTRTSTQSVSMLVEQADQALYQAKQAGRNRLHVAGQFMDDTFEFGSILT